MVELSDAQLVLDWYSVANQASTTRTNCSLLTINMDTIFISERVFFLVDTRSNQWNTGQNEDTNTHPTSCHQDYRSVCCRSSNNLDMWLKPRVNVGVDGCSNRTDYFSSNEANRQCNYNISQEEGIGERKEEDVYYR